MNEMGIIEKTIDQFNATRKNWFDKIDTKTDEIDI